MTKLVLVPTDETTHADKIDDRPAVGSWWWVQGSGHKANEYDKPGRLYLACVIEVGSNYAKVQGVSFSNRLALDDFHDLCTAELNPDVFIAGKLAEHKGNVRELMGQIQQLCHQLGVPFAQALAEAEASSQSLAVAHGIADVKRYEKALVKAKEKTLPELFKKVKEQHEYMATWMKADLIPMHAELASCTGIIEVIDQKIHTVELYAGLQERLEQVREGDAASSDAKVHLMQRRHYMDEECLAKYEAGGMNFESIGSFDKWLCRDENFARILPHERCIVAFRIRRKSKDYGDLNAFIAFQFDQQDKRTFLYIRNGRQLWRLETSIDFGARLFPDRDSHELLGSEDLWIKPSHRDDVDIISGRQRAHMFEACAENRRRKAREIWAWHNAGKPRGNWLSPQYPERRYVDEDTGEPYNTQGKPSTWDSGLSTDAGRYKPLEPTNIYYDDAMKQIMRDANAHNRVAVVIQGLLDRSVCLHPHPPWRLWTMEGFTQAIQLVYDDSKALTSGDAPVFEEYRKQNIKSLKVGSFTIGQKKAWRAFMEEKYGEYKYFPAKSGKGPSFIHEVSKLYRDGTTEYAFTRSRMTAVWVPAEPGWRRRSYPNIDVTYRVPKGTKLFCVDAYTPGDFHLFYDDPRTRADYLKWAPYLLSAEDWHKDRRDELAKPLKRKRDDDDNDNNTTNEFVGDPASLGDDTDDSDD